MVANVVHVVCPGIGAHATEELFVRDVRDRPSIPFTGIEEVEPAFPRAGRVGADCVADNLRLGAAFDFRQPRRVGDAFLASEQQRLARGYDHSFLLDAACRDGSVPAAELQSADGRLAARLYTDRPALQFYSGQWLATSQRRGGGGGYAECNGLALEPGVPPDSPNHPEWSPWSDCVAEPGTAWRAWMRWEFEVR